MVFSYNKIMAYIACIHTFDFYFVDWILDTFIHVFFSFLAYLLGFESDSCMLFSS